MYGNYNNGGYDFFPSNASSLRVDKSQVHMGLLAVHGLPLKKLYTKEDQTSAQVRRESGTIKTKHKNKSVHRCR